MNTKTTTIRFRLPADPKPWTPTPEIVEAMVRRIVERFDPERVILFGSLARDEATADSDVDLLVVVQRVADRLRMLGDVLAALAEAPSSKDVLVATNAEARNPMRHDWKLVKALREGKEVYRRSEGVAEAG